MLQAAIATLGDLNGPIIGIVMRECARRATVAIRALRFTHHAEEKGQKADGGIDWVTDADTAAQRVYVKLLRECFPLIGIVAEEDELRVECSAPGVDAYFTVDPLDGTAAFKRKQSHGVGTMISLVVDDIVIAVCIGDVNTGEVYFFRPGSENTWRIDPHGFADGLQIDGERPLSDQYLLLRDPPQGDLIKKLSLASSPFRSYEVTGGSIGISMARLWTGEVGGAVLGSNKSTPWDSNPIFGMSTRLGFVCFEIIGDQLDQFAMSPVKSTKSQDHLLLVIHHSRINELMAWTRANGVTLVTRRA